MAAQLPILCFATAAAWEEWLEENHAGSSGIWMKIAKGDAGTSVGYPRALEAALCYGWIDGQKRKLDASWWLQKFAPRGPASVWSRINREKAIALVETGRMRPAGLAAIERAKESGQWDRAYESQRTAGVPPDLERELAANARARAFFATLNSQNRYAIIHRLQRAAQPETRARRLHTFVEMLERGLTIHPQRPKRVSPSGPRRAPR